MKRLMDAVFFKKNPENPSPIADFSKNNLYSCRLMMYINLTERSRLIPGLRFFLVRIHIKTKEDS